ncbi:MAG: B12-binding domain-containing radical SAM protein, partial [Planctomycetes bacterium]|nr:B12-binding domain-containing radical SAM protein [Planctomycetota bacterium]
VTKNRRMNNVTENQLKPAVVLVADRTLSADYKILFEGIFATMQTTQIPEVVMHHFMAPAAKTDGSGRAHQSPLGLRRVESALLKYTNLTADDVVCTTPEKLAGLLGPWTKVVGFSSSDPLGMGMSNTTTANFWKGELYTRFWTRKIFKQIIGAKQKYGFKVVGGGGGAWQWDRYDDETSDECLDVVIEGYFEGVGPKLFEDLIEGRETQSYICEKTTAADRIQPIAGPSMLGIVELSRGCGRGCKFCTMAAKKMAHVPQDIILADLQTNVAAGIRSVVSGTEDFFRYGSDSTAPDFDKLAGLLKEMQRIKGLSFMQIDHGNITSVLQLSEVQLREIRKLLTWEQKTDYLWVNMGIESANGHLVAKSCSGKIAPFRPEDWNDMVIQAAERMDKTGFFPVFSVILGLPGETRDDVKQTLKLIKKLQKYRAVIFPIFYEPLRIEEIQNDGRFTIDKIRADHLELYSSCYEINFKRVPKLFWDNQRAGGVSWIKRAMLQMLGKTEVVSWRRTFRKVGRQIDRRSQSPLESNNAG